MTMRTFTLAGSLAFGAALIAAVPPAAAQQKPAVDPARVDAAIKSAFPTAPADWQQRLVPDETMKQCSAYRNSPPKAVFEAIQAREKTTIQYPADGKFLGDWKKGEALAQSGFGLRFTDYPPGNRANGGNCYACHQLTKREVSYGTIGPSLLEYGKLRKFSEDDAKTVYEKTYNSHATFPCSLMPRFGSNKVLTIEQIKDAVALLMSPDSPVNK
jgi:L-cysteine S-thiosulfotransferase